MGRKMMKRDLEASGLVWHNPAMVKPLRWEEVLCEGEEWSRSLFTAYYSGSKWVCNVTRRAIPESEIYAWCYVPRWNDMEE